MGWLGIFAWNLEILQVSRLLGDTECQGSRVVQSDGPRAHCLADEVVLFARETRPPRLRTARASGPLVASASWLNLAWPGIQGEQCLAWNRCRLLKLMTGQTRARTTVNRPVLILSIKVTRLARKCSDWYPLLDICGLRGCLIADRDGVYDPGKANGRLLLGLKGTISELELHTN
jgi:hypothetical protein